MQILLKKEFNAGDFVVYSDRPEETDLITVHQIHSNKVLLYPFNSTNKADGMIIQKSELKNSWLAIKTADCLPVLFLSEDYISLVHAGWRGLKDEILIQPELKNISWDSIFIGPCIGRDSFEVQKDFSSHFPNSPNFNEKNGRLTFDLVNEAKQQLAQNFKTAEISASEVCTFKNYSYNSYRRDKTEFRNWNTFQLRG